ncbi:hypothetical protein KIW84_043903 [Lathyrus oleraceus]|uniref:Uncharacterized protein n=1 Tax=Pisum sativum TaxID=3888 RepID=A0A9D5ASC5_PEA|nr:hypothetical protein KIW84_043903 [Pisum sativum]
MLHYAYNAIKKSMEAYVTRAGGKVIEVPLPFVDAAHSIGCTDVDMHKIGVFMAAKYMLKYGVQGHLNGGICELCKGDSWKIILVPRELEEDDLS